MVKLLHKEIFVLFINENHYNFKQKKIPEYRYFYLFLSEYQYFKTQKSIITSVRLFSLVKSLMKLRASVTLISDTWK